MKVHIVYPENRIVDESVVYGWYMDALADGRVEDIPEEEYGLTRVCDVLDDAGIITVRRFV